MKRMYFLLLFFPILGTSLDFKEFIQDVVKNNGDLAATRERIRAAEFFEKRVQILDDPFFRVMRHDQPFGSKSESAFSPKIRYELMQLFPFPGKLSLKGKIAHQQVLFLESETLATMQDLILQAKRLYFQLYFNEAAFKINALHKAIVSEFIQTTFALYKSGQDGFFEAVKAQVELQNLSDEELQLIAEKNRLISMMNAILNRNPFESLDMPKENFTPLLPLNFNELQHLALQYNPEIQGIEAKVGEQKFRKDLAKREYFPDLTVGTRFDHRIASNDTAWGVSLGINVPIWIPWKQHRAVQEAAALIRSEEDTLFNTKALIDGRIREILAAIQASEEQIFLLETGILPKTLEGLEAGKSEYKTGRGDFLTLLDTIRQYYQYQLEFEKVRVQREIYLAELERTIGRNLLCY